jgi:hypothetical protein
MILVCYPSFLFMKMNLVVCGFYIIIRACVCLLLSFMRLFDYLCLAVGC